MAVIETIIV